MCFCVILYHVSISIFFPENVNFFFSFCSGTTHTLAGNGALVVSVERELPHHLVTYGLAKQLLIDYIKDQEIQF